jgi:hypothetical protein
MEMSWTQICVTPPGFVKLLLLFCLVWPFVSLRWKVPSLTAMLLPIALATGAVWLGFVRIMEGLAISGGGVASTAAGTAEAWIALFLGLCSAAAVLVFALLRRRVPVVDRVVLGVSIVLLGLIVFGFVFARTLDPARKPIALLVAGVAGAIAIFLAVWLVVGNGTPAPAAVVWLMIVLYAGAGAFAWEEAGRYRGIAMRGMVRTMGDGGGDQIARGPSSSDCATRG